MPVTKDQPGPYAPASAVMSVVDRYRQKGLPVPVDADVLARAGISESLIPRTLYALQTLDLVDAGGNPTQVLEGIKLAPEAEYKIRLGEWLKNAYADLLQFVDPTTADDTAIRDAFRGYRPHGQVDRMVTLFWGLFRAAGIAPEKASSGTPRKKTPATASKPRSTVVAPKVQDGGTVHSPKSTNFDGALPPAISGLLVSLPTHGEGWTKEQRDAFMTTFGVVVDFCFPPGVVTKPKTMAEDANAADT
jgi:hypothetical protein